MVDVVQDAHEVPVESAPTKTIEELTQEYNQLCAKAGDLAYKIKCNEGDLAHTYKQIHDAVIESFKLKGVTNEQTP